LLPERGADSLGLECLEGGWAGEAGLLPAWRAAEIARGGGAVLLGSTERSWRETNS